MNIFRADWTSERLRGAVGRRWNKLQKDLSIVWRKRSRQVGGGIAAFFPVIFRTSPLRLKLLNSSDWSSAQAPDEYRLLEVKPARYICFPKAVGYADKLHITHSVDSRNFSASCKIIELQGALVLPSPFAIITRDNVVLRDFSSNDFDAQTHPLLGLRYSTKQRVEGRVLSLLTDWVGNYCHWLVDLLPKINELEKTGLFPAEFDVILVPHLKNEYDRLTLQLMGIDLRKVLPVDKIQNSVLDIVGSLTAVTSVHTHPFIDKETFRWLHDRLAISCSSRRPEGEGRRLFVNRNSAAWRRVINWEEIVPVLNRFNFEIVQLESLSFREQQGVFASAGMVVGAHGAGFTNLLFCPPGVKVLEIFSPLYVNPIYQTVCQSIGLDYRFMYGDGEFEEGPYVHTFDKVAANIYIPPERFEGALMELFKNNSSDA